MKQKSLQADNHRAGLSLRWEGVLEKEEGKEEHHTKSSLYPWSVTHSARRKKDKVDKEIKGME
jgi:hypothetical protein